ncbi:hypothetical protein J2T13_003615 [Paenibacillus sp. DS2015]|uniref:AlbA family DNA-binding domain-containing protein n=1 Tax=Paenibacillus sp. DS2015 TaxID=3373917 RepID=UPI003D1B091E
MSTYSKRLDNVSLDDLQQFAQFNMKEDQHHEFKGEMPHADSFCAAITSFANTFGGDFFLGIDAPEDGTVSLPGIATTDTDKELLKFMNILQNGVEPKLPHIDTKVFQVSEGCYVFLFRVGRSWVRPHRIKGSAKFYSRKSNGKFPLDVFELRQIFAESGDFANKVRQFREERVLHHSLKFGSKPFTLVHLLPVSCFENRFALDLSLFSSLRLTPMASAGWNPQINFHGIYSEADGKEELSLTQVFRNGIIEGASSRLTRDCRISSQGVPKNIFKFVNQNVMNYEMMGMQEPFYVIVSMYGVQGYVFEINRERFDSPPPLDEDRLIFPEVIIETRTDLKEQLTPIFDALWNAFGFMSFTE